MTTEDYMKMPYTRMIRPIADESGSYYVAEILEFDGCMSVGDTFDEAYANLTEAMALWIDVRLSEGKPVPPCAADEQYSGKFVLRLPKSLHRKLATEASLEGVSLNQYALYKLAQ